MIPPSPVLEPGLGGIMDLGLGGIMDSSTVIIVGLAKEIPRDRGRRDRGSLPRLPVRSRPSIIDMSHFFAPPIIWF